MDRDNKSPEDDFELPDDSDESIFENLIGMIREYVRRDRTLMLIPERLLLVERLSFQLHDLLTSNKNRFEIEVARAPLCAEDVIIRITTDSLETTFDSFPRFKQIINSVDGVSVFPAVDEQVHIWLEIKNVFVEVENGG